MDECWKPEDLLMKRTRGGSLARTGELARPARERARAVVRLKSFMRRESLHKVRHRLLASVGMDDSRPLLLVT